MTARSIRKGDIVMYEGRPYSVLSIMHEGLWDPYFELPDIGLVSHTLTTLPERVGVPVGSGV